MNLCKYSNIFGEPRTGLHAIRIFDLAIVDILLTLLGAYFAKSYVKLSLMKTFFLMWAIGTALHILFCVKTPITKLFKN